jgi:hypothetical protein
MGSGEGSCVWEPDGPRPDDEKEVDAFGTTSESAVEDEAWLTEVMYF